MKKQRIETSIPYSGPMFRLVDITPRANVCQKISGMGTGGNSGDDEGGEEEYEDIF